MINLTQDVPNNSSVRIINVCASPNAGQNTFKACITSTSNDGEVKIYVFLTGLVTGAMLINVLFWGLVCHKCYEKRKIRKAAVAIRDNLMVDGGGVPTSCSDEIDSGI